MRSARPSWPRSRRRSPGRHRARGSSGSGCCGRGRQTPDCPSPPPPRASRRVFSSRSADHLGRAERPMARVERRHQRLRVVQPARHLHRLGAQLNAALHVARVSRSRPPAARALWPATGCPSSGRAASASSSRPSAGDARLEAGEQQEAAEPDYVAERGAGEHLAVAQPASQVGGLLEAGPGGRRVSGTPAGVSQGQQEVASALARGRLRGAEQAKRPVVVQARLLVGELLGRPVPCPHQIVDRRRDIAERGRHRRDGERSPTGGDRGRSGRAPPARRRPCDAVRGARLEARSS